MTIVYIYFISLFLTMLIFYPCFIVAGREDEYLELEIMKMRK